MRPVDLELSEWFAFGAAVTAVTFVLMATTGMTVVLFYAITTLWSTALLVGERPVAVITTPVRSDLVA